MRSSSSRRCRKARLYMKQPERFPPDDSREWMNRARSNLARAKTRVPGAYLEDSCFDAQQATEKAIKAVMIMQDIDFPYTHDLAHLMMILEAGGERIPDAVRRAAKLTRYAIHTRYPGLEEPVSEQEYREAVAIAESVVRWAEERL